MIKTGLIALFSLVLLLVVMVRSNVMGQTATNTPSPSNTVTASPSPTGSVQGVTVPSQGPATGMGGL